LTLRHTRHRDGVAHTKGGVQKPLRKKREEGQKKCKQELELFARSTQTKVTGAWERVYEGIQEEVKDQEVPTSEDEADDRPGFRRKKKTKTGGLLCVALEVGKASTSPNEEAYANDRDDAAVPDAFPRRCAESGQHESGSHLGQTPTRGGNELLELGPGGGSTAN